MSKLVYIFFVMGSVGLTAHIKFAYGGVTNAKAAELALHRVERLVILKKIEEGFQYKVKSFTLELVPHQNEEEPSFKATLFQYPPKDPNQKPKAVTIRLDEEGKPIKEPPFVEGDGEADGAPQWPDKDPVTLAESALHYVLEGSVTKPELGPYHEGITEFTVTQEINQASEAVAVVDFKAKDQPILRVRIKMDASFDSSEFIPQTKE